MVIWFESPSLMGLRSAAMGFVSGVLFQQQQTI